MCNASGGLRVTHRVVFSPEAENDLLQLYLYIAEQSGDGRALDYIERLERYCHGFAEFPERGASRDDLFPGLRVVGFERRVSIAFHITADTVTFDRILYGGRDMGVLSEES
jgi:toxin ParE1/3/4